MKKIVLTGGGTAGHVTPNIALIPELKKAGYEISYIGSYEGMERKMIEALGIRYRGISSGKFRRYFSLKNFTDPFRVLKGFREAVKVMKEIKPDIVFSKGGFVTVPVVFAARKCKIPVIIHESDMTPGLANKLCIPKATYVCTNFPETLEALPEGKAVYTGTPIREELFTGDREAGLRYLGFSGEKPVLLVVGGSLGALNVNRAIRRILPTLTEKYDVAHLCGKGKADPSYDRVKGYVQIEYVDKELKDVFAATDLAVSRAGANAIGELLQLNIPNLLIPLPASASRGDQILNAKSFEKQGYSLVLFEETMTDALLLQKIDLLYKEREKFLEKMKGSPQTDAVKKIMTLIKNAEK